MLYESQSKVRNTSEEMNKSNPVAEDQMVVSRALVSLLSTAASNINSKLIKMSQNLQSQHNQMLVMQQLVLTQTMDHSDSVDSCVSLTWII